MKNKEIQIDTVELTVEDYQKIVTEKDAEIVALKTTIDKYSEIVAERDNKIKELQDIIDAQDSEIEKTEKIVIADSDKQKIVDAGLIPVMIAGKLKGAVTTVFAGVHLDDLSEEEIDELDALGTVFITVE